MIYTFKDEKYAFLSNMTLVEILYDGHIFMSVENAYQYAKCKTDDWLEFCLKNSPYKVKKESNNLKNKRKDWDDVKLSIMEELLVQKFSKHPFKTLLKQTGNQNISEGNMHNDSYWGIDLKQNPNIGENHLGRLQMKIRDENNLKNKGIEF